jgi:6-phosphofructokinase 1
VREAVNEHGYCSIVVSEGVRDTRGRFLAETGTRDAFGHAQLGGVAPVVAELVKSKLGYKYHWAVSDYLQRSARHVASETDVDQAYSVGQAAVEFALEGKNGVMPVIKRLSDKPYKWTIAEAKLSQVANREKLMPKRFITKDGFGITPSARKYLEPLIRGEAYPPYERDGLPAYVRLRRQLVDKKLPPFKV